MLGRALDEVQHYDTTKLYSHLVLRYAVNRAWTLSLGIWAADGNAVGDVCQSCGLARMIADITIDNNEGSPVDPLAWLNGILYFSNYEQDIGRLKWAYDVSSTDARKL